MADAPENTYAAVTDDVLTPLGPPRVAYYLVLAVLACGIALFFSTWAYQVQTGMGITGLNHPVGWAVYIANFVFWVGIAHSGTLISAILHLVRSRWRTAIARAAEAMTVFAVMTAGLFPLVHLGRLWVVYYIIQYPSQRQLWPNFDSPLVWDVVAVTTYLTVSTIFWFVGLIPDLASARDRARRLLGPDHVRTRLYNKVALGWSGSGSQWRHHGRAYLFFAALATPLVISVHSVVSWDFAMGILPGWHTTIFAPYFVAGAIHSGLAMVLTLVIPMRRFLHLERVITPKHFDAVAQTMLVTTAIVAYAYIIEPFMAWYCGDIFEQQFAWWRATGWMAVFYWALFLFNVIAPLAFIFKRYRYSLKALFIVSILVNIGMWLERFVIVVGSTSHDFLPHNWGQYAARWPEICITAGAFCFFLFWFFGFTKMVPTVGLSDVKEDELLHRRRRQQAAGSGQQAEGNRQRPTANGQPAEEPFSRDPQGSASAGASQQPDAAMHLPPVKRLSAAPSGLLAVFRDSDAMLAALLALRRAGYDRLETYGPVRVHEAEELMGRGASPVRYWTLVGALLGLTGGFALAIGSAMVNDLVVGGKFTPRTIIPYCIIGFEGTVLLGVIGNLLGVIVHCRLGRHKPLPASYDERFSRDCFGILVETPPDALAAPREVLTANGANEIRELGAAQ